MRIWKSVAVASVVALAAGIAMAMQQDGRSTPGSLAYQGQNTGMFQMFFSPFTRQDSFMLDTARGRVWVLKAGGERNAFEGVSVNPTPDAAGQPGRYRIYFGASVRADTFMMDTASGQVWTLVTDPSMNTPYFAGTAVK